MAPRSRWFVGSSRMMTSVGSEKRRARATRFSCPPERCSTSTSRAPSIPRRASVASISQPSPRAWRTVPEGRTGICSRKPTVAPWPRRTTPEVGVMAPARIRKSDDFPAPLIPTTPTRSPDEIVSERSSRRSRSAPSRFTCARSRRMATGLRG